MHTKDLLDLYPLFDETLATKLLAISQEVAFEPEQLIMRPGQYFRSAL